MVERCKIRMPLTQPARLLLRREVAFAEQADRIAVPGRDIEVLAYVVMVEANEVPDEIVRHRTVRAMTADNGFLLGVEVYHLIAVEAAKIEDVGRVGFGDRGAGKIHFGEAAIFLRPEDRAPGGVQRIDRAIAALEP